MSAAGTGGAPEDEAPAVRLVGEPGVSALASISGFTGAVAVGVDAAVSLVVEERASGIATSFNDAGETVGTRAEEVPSSPFESFCCCVDVGPVFARL